VGFLERLAKETGGRLFFARKDADSEITEQIAHDLRRQYVLKYRSSNAEIKSRYKVEIKVSDGRDKTKRKAILRPAYTSQLLLKVDK
jgi:23S rRNA-/tRNA-specific pseudouridylate synthase